MSLTTRLHVSLIMFQYKKWIVGYQTFLKHIDITKIKNAVQNRLRLPSLLTLTNFRIER